MTKLESLIAQLYPEGVEFKKLGDVCEIKTGKGLTKKDLEIEGYPVISGGVQPLGFYPRWNRKSNTVTISRAGTAGYVDFITTEFWVNDKCFSVIPFEDEKISSKFLFYSLKNMQQEIYNLKSSGTVPTVNTQKLSKIQIPVPPLKVQEEIVRILDKFTSLEAELEARKKQYEHYRNALLTFENTDLAGGGYDGRRWGRFVRFMTELIKPQNIQPKEFLLLVLKTLTTFTPQKREFQKKTSKNLR